MRASRASAFFFILWAAALTAQDDILLITLDTTRMDHLSCYGYGQKTTPVLDEFAKGATVFTRAYTPAPYTLPAHATLLTGLWPKDHGVRDNIVAPLKPSVATVAALLQAAGYRTAAFVSSFVLDRRFGLGRGFALYDDRMSVLAEDDEQRNERPAEETARAAADFLSGLPGGERVFLWVHFYDPHSPYLKHLDSPPGMGDYDGEILHMDRSIGSLLGAWTQRRRGLVVITADHGESLGDHGEEFHGIFLYEPCVRVPLLVRAEGRMAAGRDDRLVSLADVAATLLDFSGISRPAMPGRSLLSPGPLHQRLYFESFIPANNFGWSSPFGILKDGHKYIHLPKPELYDLASDPGELKNRAGSKRAEARALRAQLEREYGMRYTPPVALPDPETARRLEALGYRGGSRAHPEKDPKDLIWVVEAMDRARALGKGGQTAGAERIFRDILQANPENSPVRLDLSALLKRVGRREEARALLQEGVQLDRLDAYALYDLGVLDTEENRLDEAERRFKTVLLLAPEHIESLFSLFWVASKSGDAKAAHGYLERAARLQPDHPSLPYCRGVEQAQKGDLKGAVIQFQACLRLKPDRLDALTALGQAYFNLGRFEDSAAVYARALEVHPGQPQVYLHLGTIYLNYLNDPRKALDYFRTFLERFPQDGEAPQVREIIQGLQKAGQ